MVEEALSHVAVPAQAPAGRSTDYFGELVFGRNVMRRYLDRETYEALIQTMEHGTPLTREVADGIAAGMKQWAVEHGADHYTHWFQPLTGGTAEKHDSFAEPDGRGGVLEEFSGKLLVQQEPDASSFPNGGIRNTFEARGYSAWDPASPAFIVGSTLCIPTVFIAYTGEALDYKTPLLRSLAAVDKAATEVCRYFDRNVTKVFSYLGWEQEYFLVDEALWAARPDLVLTGRTLMGHESAKNQQLEDHYFGAIPERVIEFMRDLEYESLRLGIPVKTRHNEVAPNQFELAPIYEEANLANDHNQLLMTIMNKIARRHNFRILLHEKPFKGVNGSGKHNNWSLGTDTGVNLLGPGKTPSENLQFITFLVNVMAAVYRHNGLLKASIMSATNAHRLGANEAPPAIISTFLGAQISAVLEKLEASRSDAAITFSAKNMFKMSGISHIPTLMLDNTDRNRTSPFAFTGNRFEFRAVGSSDNCADAMLTLNTAVAEQLTRFKEAVDRHIESGMKKEKAIYEELKKLIRECKPIHFDGNGYSDEWKAEGARLRNLDAADLRPLSDRRFDPHVREHGRAEQGGDRSPHRGEMGDLHQKDPDRRARAGRPDDEPHRPDRLALRGDAAGQGIQNGADRRAGRLGRHRSAQKDTGTHGRHPDAHDRDDRSAQEGQPHRKRTREGDRLPRHGGGLLRGDPPPHRQARRDHRRPDVDAAQISGTSVHQIGSVIFSQVVRTPRKCFRGVFLQPTPPEQPRHNEPLPMPASDSVRRTFRNHPGPAVRGRPLVFPHPPHPSKCPPCRRSRRRPMQHARAKRPTGSFRADRSDYSGFFPTFVRIFPASAGGAAREPRPA